MSKHRKKHHQKPKNEQKVHRTGVCNSGEPYVATPIPLPKGVEVGPAAEGAEDKIREIMKEHGLLK